jgi:hypothetical protein
MEPDGMTTPALYAPPPVEEEEDILHETLRAEIERASVAAAANSDHVFEEPAAMPTSEVQTVTFEPEKGEFVFHGTTEEEGIPQYEEQPTDLQPGGVGSGEIQQTFALESMTTKELRRLANQRGISGVSDMKKKEIIAAIRALPSIDIFAEGVATE